MFCEKCGSQLGQGARFCPECGEAISRVAVPPPLVGPPPMAPPLPPTAPSAACIPVASPSIATAQHHEVDHDDIVYAGFMRRFAALFLDQIILTAALIFLGLLVGIPLGLFSGTADQVHKMAQSIYFLLWLVGAPLYYAGMESSRHQATLGKRALGIKVTDDAGQRLNFGHALGRWVSAALSHLTLDIGFLMAAFTERKRALHDILASTLVVDRWSYTDHPDRQQRSTSGCLVSMMIAMCLAVIAILAAIAIPAYQDYVIRSQVSEGASLAEGSKTAVEQAFSSTSRFPANNEAAGVAKSASITGNYVSGVKIEDGNIYITYSSQPPQKANPTLAGKVLLLAPAISQGRVGWTCQSNIAPKYLPVSCRSPAQPPGGTSVAPTAPQTPAPAMSAEEAARDANAAAADASRAAAAADRAARGVSTPEDEAESIAQLTQAVKDNPQDGRSWELLGIYKYHGGDGSDMDGAVNALQHALAISPGCTETGVGLIVSDACDLLLGFIYADRGDLPAAATYFKSYYAFAKDKRAVYNWFITYLQRKETSDNQRKAISMTLKNIASSN